MTEPGAAFWSGETLAERLSQLVDPFVSDRIDCAAYQLAVGPEVYISPDEKTPNPTTTTVRRLGLDEAFAIPPGQFAHLLTEEIVSVPDDALAFISIRARVKFRGLINVSGFHVDPGYRGQLTFAVYNAGPAPVQLQRGYPCFLIWYASLDRKTEHKKRGPVQRGLNIETISYVSGELQSLAGLSNRIKDVDKSLGERIHAIEREQATVKVIGTLVLAVVVALIVGWVKEAVIERSTQAAPVDIAAPRSR